MPAHIQLSRQRGQAPRRDGTPAARQNAFDWALAKVAPDLTRPERTFLAAVAGMREADLFTNATFRDIEAAPYGSGTLVIFADNDWRRRVGLRHQHSSRFVLTDAGRDLVLRAAREIEVTR